MKIVIEVGGKKTAGFVTSVLSLVRSQHQQPVGEGSTVLEQCLTHDWLTYFATQLFHCPSHEVPATCLRYINKELENREYLCGFCPTVADVVLFLALHPFVLSWSYMQKEQYLNISRWFSTMQNDKRLSLTYSSAQFSRTQLYHEGIKSH